ncbi:helix-turn-helix domain-containing protein [Streptomyces sp. NPDC060232]|uniref:helix-turn-helix domain-containing protein n=1 Tax=Streptomyces sp. NPDC060232 TaxID=3347079 RepID=UPI00364A8B2B
MTTDLGRRLAARRTAAGMSREELGERCGADAHYIASLEDRAVLPTAGVLVRLAEVLGTTVDALAGPRAAHDPGRPVTRPRTDAQPVVLDEEECRRLLGVRGIGRVAVFTADGPAVHPVNYLISEDGIAFRTGADSVLARAAGTEAAFEAEQIDEVAARGWSVLAVGVIEAAPHPAALGRRADSAHATPWAGGERTHWMTIAPHRLTGRRVEYRP